MKSTSALAVFLLLALTLTGFGLFLWMGADPTSVAPLAGDEPALPVALTGETPAAPRAGTPDEEPQELDAPQLVATAGEESQRTVANPNEAAEAAATWVQGLAQMPAGAPLDPELEAYALAGKTTYGDFTRQMLEGHLDVLAQCPVDPGGEFRLPFPEGMTEGWVILRGRFLYQPKAVQVDLTGREPGIRPRAELGACISGAVALPEGMEGELSEDFELGLRSQIGEMNPVSTSAQATRMRLTVPVEDGQFSTGALPVPMEYVLVTEDPILAGTRVTIGELQPGEDRVLALHLTRGGSLSGRVVNMDAQLVAGAKVTASLSGSFFGLDDHAVRVTVTDEAGDFELIGVPADTVRLRAEADGMLPSKRLTADVTEGGEVAGLLLELDEGGVLTGQVRWDVGGLAEGVEIRVRFDPAYMGGLDALSALRGAEGKATSDADGRFRVTGLGKGPFVVRAKAQAPWDERESEAVTWTAKLSGVRPGTGDLELLLKAPVGLRGRVVDDLGQPVQVFRLFLQPTSTGAMAGLAYMAGGGNSSPERTFDSEDGSFFMEGLEAGSYQVWVRDDDHVSLEPVPVDLTDDALPVEIIAARAARVSGVVHTPQGEACEGAQVGPGGGGLDLQTLTKGGPEPPSTQSDESGHFELAGIAPGAQSITAQSDDWAASPPLTVQLAPGEYLEDVTLLLSMGGNLTGEIFDDEGHPATGHMVTIIGLETMLSSGGLSQRISMSDGEGHFHFEHLEPGSWQVTAIDRSREWTSDDGELDMGNLMSSIKLTQADIIEGETTHVVLGAPPEDPVRVFGDVTLAGAPYSDATLSFIRAGQGLGQGLTFTAVDDDGGYELVLDGAGKYQVNVQRLGGGPGQQTTIEFSIEIPQTTEHRLDFVLPLGRISGRIMGPDRKPAVGARVTVTLDEDARSDRLFGGQYSELQADAEGRFDVVGLRPGTYRVSAGGAAFMGLGKSDLGRITRGDLQLDEDEWLEHVDLALPGAGTLAFTVTGLDGSPAAGATIFVRDAEGRPLEPFSMVATDATGRVKYEGLAPGDYTVLARNSTHTSQESGTVTVRQDQTTPVELSLGEGTILWVQIKEGGKDGMPLPGSVRVIDEHGRDVASMLGIQDLQFLYVKDGFADNEHRLGPLPAGRYVVEVDSNGRTRRKPVTLTGGGERRIVIRLR